MKPITRSVQPILLYLSIGVLASIFGARLGIGRWLHVILFALMFVILIAVLKKRNVLEEYGLRFNFSDLNCKRALIYLMPLLIPFATQFVGGFIPYLSFAEIAQTVLLMFFIASLEEIIFRSSLIISLKESQSSFSSIILAAAIFALVHIVNLTSGLGVVELLLQVASAFAFACILGFIFERCQTIVPGVVFHFLFNVAGALCLTSIPAQIVCTICFTLIACIGALMFLRYTHAHE